MVYALNKSSPQYSIARRFLRIFEGKLNIAHQNVLETLRVITHPTYKRHFGTVNVGKVQDFIEEMNVLSPSGLTYFLNFELIKKYKISGNTVFDAYLVATMLSNNIKIIVTDNEKHFLKFEEIKVFNPFK